MKSLANLRNDAILKSQTICCCGKKTNGLRCSRHVALDKNGYCSSHSVQHEHELEESDVFSRPDINRDGDNREDYNSASNESVIMLKAIRKDLAEVKHDLSNVKTNMKALLRRIEDIETENKQLRETKQRLIKQVEEDNNVLKNEIALRNLSDQMLANIQVDLRKLTY
jgi:septal ring factor EnvC (AmiA/AmiB activator)